jgi:hypothetical protein
MKKFLFTITLLAFAVLAAKARSVVFVLTDSTKVYYAVADGQPAIRLSKTGFKVGADSYEFSRFDRFYLSDDDGPSSIANLLQERPRFDHGLFVAETTQPVALYGINGRPVRVRQWRDAQRIAVDTASLPAGIYLIRIGSESIKFTKK